MALTITCRLPQPKKRKKTPENARVPTRVLEDSVLVSKPNEENSSDRGLRDQICVPSPDSAIGLSKSSEEIAEKKNTRRLEKVNVAGRTPSESSSSGVTSSGCDSSDSSAIAEDRVREADRNPPFSSDSETDVYEAVNSSAERGEERTTVKASLKPSSEKAANVDSTVIVKDKYKFKCGGAHDEIEDSDETVENEKSGNVDERVGTPIEFELHYTEPPEPMRDDNCAIDSDSDNDISETPRSRGGRRVAFSGMSTMEPLSVDVGDNCGPPNVSLDDLPPNITLAPSNLPEPMLADDDHQEAAPNAILLSLLSRPSPSRSERRDHRIDDSSDLTSFLHPDPDLDVNKTSTPIEPLRPMSHSPSLTPTPTPTPSEGSSHNGTAGSSGSGTHASAGSTSSEVHKKEDSDSSFDHSDGHIVPSDISTATCNETGETLECRTDSDERLQELEDGHDRPDSARGSDYDTPTEAKAAVGGGLSSFLNLDDLGEISIQLITLADVLEVVAKGYRSVTDEEIKRYTDFMVWFSNVAKSACTHTKEGSHKANAPLLDDISVDSTIYDTPSIAKKRKGPLRKLGRFLLKALMFILD